MLQENPADAPLVCHGICGVGARNRDKYSYLRSEKGETPSENAINYLRAQNRDKYV